MSDIIVNVNIGSDVEDDKTPKVTVKKKKVATNPEKRGGVLTFPQQTSPTNPILDILGIKET